MDIKAFNRFHSALRMLHQQAVSSRDGLSDDRLHDAFFTDRLRFTAARAIDAQVVEVAGLVPAVTGAAAEDLRPTLSIGRSGTWIHLEGTCSCAAHLVEEVTCDHIIALADLVAERLQTGHGSVSLVRNLLNGMNLAAFVDDGPLDATTQLEREDREAAGIFAQLATTGSAASAPPPTVEVRRLWRVHASYQRIVAEWCVQRMGKRGTWLKPTAIDAYRMGEHLAAAQPEDLALLRLVQNYTFDVSGSLRRHAHWRLLLGRPLVLGGDFQPLRHEEAVLTAAVERDGEAWQVCFPALREGDWSLIQELEDGLVAIDADGGHLVLFQAAPDVLGLWRRRQRLRFGAVTAQSAAFRNVVARAGVVLPAELEGETVAADAGTQVALRWEGDRLGVELACRPIPACPLLTPGEGQERLHARLDGDRWVVAVRRFTAEREAAAAMRTRLGLPEAGWRWTLDLDAGADLIERLATADIAPHWQGPATQVREADQRQLRVRVRRERDWLGIEAGLRIDDRTIALADLLTAARGQGRWVRLDQGHLLRLSEDLRRRLRQLAAAGERAADSAAPLIDDALDGLDDAQLDCDKAWLALQRRLREARDLDPRLPRTLRATLRPYQREGFTWMARLAAWGPGAVLADDMGLGKTVQAIALLLLRAKTGPALVVCPTSVEGNWCDELARFAPSLSVRLFREDRGLDGLKAGQVVLASYGLVQRREAVFAALHFATLILDEAQQAKNADAKRTQALAAVPADWRLALSGTPLENRLDELWSIMRLVVPGLLGSREDFATRFAGPIEMDHDAGRRDELRRRIAPFVLRRTKAQVAPELPERTEITHRVDLTAAERDLYEAERLRAADELEGGGEDRRFAILAALTRLRQLACAPGLLLDGHEARSTKLDALVELATEMKDGGHRALVFSQFTRLLDLAGRRLHDAGLTCLRLDGTTPAAKRRELVADFQGGTGDVFLISLKAGGTGLNLTAADYVIHLDPWWNPAAEDQATDRTHRIGQTRPVTVYRLIAAGTVEERILDLHREKRDLIDALLADGDRAARLDSTQLLALLRQA